MEVLPAEFDTHGFHYTQLWREGKIALYRQQRHGSHILRYEVVIIHIQRTHTWQDGVTTPEKAFIRTLHTTSQTITTREDAS